MFEVLQGTVAAFGIFLPNLVSVRHHDPDDTRRQKDVRIGLLLAGVWSFFIAAHYAHKTGSGKPYGYWLVGNVAMIVAYEFALQDRDDIDLR